MKNKNNVKIAIVIGTRAELIKCMPIMLELEKQNKEYCFIHTGQHSLKGSCEEFGIKKPDFVVSNAPKKETKFLSKINSKSITWFLTIIPKLRKIIRKINPKYVIYHGDTMNTIAASIASSNLLNLNKKWKNVHLEAGLRSWSLFEPFPEEISRKISDKFSDILFAVSEGTKKNLSHYKKDKKVILTGNTIVDSSLIIHENSKKKYKKEKENYVLINIHRHENLNKKERLENIIKILSNVKIKAIWPLHENTLHYLKEYGLINKIKNLKNFEINPLINYSKFIFLLSNCKYLITDGGSIQEESLVFKKPCILLRKKTERQEGLETGINFLTNLDIEYSKKLIETIEKKDIKIKNFENPYGKRGVSKKIVDILE